MVLDDAGIDGERTGKRQRSRKISKPISLVPISARTKR